jgi:hypothetical protein
MKKYDESTYEEQLEFDIKESKLQTNKKVIQKINLFLNNIKDINREELSDTTINHLNYLQNRVNFMMYKKTTDFNKLYKN